MTVETTTASSTMAAALARLPPFGASLSSLWQLRPVILPIATAVLFLALWQGIVGAICRSYCAKPYPPRSTR
jgi:hypothetical protein